MKEVRDTLFYMSPYKAPSPDGFQPIFFRNYRNIVSKDVWTLIANAFSSGQIDHHIADTLIVPIPKIDEPKSLKDFRPISLCNVLLKLVSTILIRSVRPHLDDLIGPLQSSFIPNRGTTDNGLVAQELVHYMHKRKGKVDYLIMFKIDVEKAYDRVDRDFLRLTLLEFGFPPHTVNLIMSCITSSSLALKWNNEKLESFAPFLLCLDKLAFLIQEKVDSHQWLPIKISSNEPAISHLFFRDDCLLFTRAKSSQVRLVKEVLQTFCLALSKINIQKSKFLPFRNVSRARVSKFEGMIDFRHTYNIGRYLGFPLLSGIVTNADFSFIMDRINSILAGWKGRLLSRAGRVTLAKSVLNSMPIYTMHNLWLPEGICDKIDSHIKQFIWGDKIGHWG